MRDGCVCDLDVPARVSMVLTFAGDADEQTDLVRAYAAARRLYAHVTDALTRGSVSAYLCCWDEERLPSLGELELDVDWFLRPAFDEVERRVLRVRRGEGTAVLVSR
jgi:hypothetical protein